jgi:hypothetical protein
LWIPRWLGEIYSNLFLRFERELFTVSEAGEALQIDKARLNVAFSHLHSKRVLMIFKRSRPRLYRLLDPSLFLLLASEIIKDVESIKQERYLPLILMAFRETLKKLHLTSFVIYGSVGRGTARDTSDVDILLISPDFKGSLGSRIEGLIEVEEAVEEELRWLREKGVYTGLSFYPLRPEEAEALPRLFLDLTEDAILLYDDGNLLERLLLTLKAKLFKLGARRVFIDQDTWYWDLKPDYRFGDVVELA